MSEEIKSPCNETCFIDLDTGFCVGCLRTGDEIADWQIYSNEQKLEVLKEIKTRKVD